MAEGDPTRPDGIHLANLEPIEQLARLDFALTHNSYIPHDRVKESMLVYTDALSDTPVQQDLFRLITGTEQDDDCVYAGIEGANFLHNRILVGEGSEAEQAGLHHVERGFHATEPIYWQQLIAARQGQDNPFKYAQRGWMFPAIVAFRKSKIYHHSLIINEPERETELLAFGNGAYEATLGRLDPDGSRRQYDTRWRVRPGETMESATDHIYYLIPTRQQKLLEDE